MLIRFGWIDIRSRRMLGNFGRTLSRFRRMKSDWLRIVFRTAWRMKSMFVFDTSLVVRGELTDDPND